MSDDEYRQSVDALIKLTRDHGPARIGINVTAFVPSAKQRKYSADKEPELQNAAMQRFAIVSESAMVRGAITALAWLLPHSKMPVRAFSPGELEAALAWLREIGTFDLERARQLIAEARQTTGE